MWFHTKTVGITAFTYSTLYVLKIPRTCYVNYLVWRKERSGRREGGEEKKGKEGREGGMEKGREKKEGRKEGQGRRKSKERKGSVREANREG